MKIIIRKFSLSICFILLSVTSIYAQFDIIIENYDVLVTIAGKGDFDDKGFNGWKEEYEGGMAVEAELSRPHFAMADKNGTVYIADKDAHAIRKILPEGTIHTIAGTSTAGDNGDGIATEHHLHSPNGLWVLSDGTVYILDLGNSKIRKLNNDGKMETVVDDPDGISIGRGLWVSEDEEVIFFCSGNKVKKWSRSDGLLIYATGFSVLGNLVVDPMGHLVVTDRSANLVYRVFDDGSKTVIAGNGSDSGGGSGFKAVESAIEGVRGIWFLPDLSFFLATHEGSQIWYVDSMGIINLFLDGREGDGHHSGDGQHFQTRGYKISEARSISVDYQGNILIAENDRGFIRKIAKKSDTKVNMREQNEFDSNISAYPNPFNSTIKFQYTVNTSQNVLIEIYDILGNRVKTLINGVQPAGIHELYWNGTENNGLPVTSGCYLYRIKTDEYVRSSRILYLK